MYLPPRPTITTTLDTKQHGVKQKAGRDESSRASSRRSSGSARAVQNSATSDAVSAKKKISYDGTGKIGESGKSGGDQLAKLGSGGSGVGGGGGGIGLGGEGGAEPGSGGVSEDHALPRTVPIPIKRRMTVTVVAGVIVDKVRALRCMMRCDLFRVVANLLYIRVSAWRTDENKPN